MGPRRTMADERKSVMPAPVFRQNPGGECRASQGCLQLRLAARRLEQVALCERQVRAGKR